LAIIPTHDLFEISWEVCNQVGGIYTVIRSKAPAMEKDWGDNYCMIGPYINKNIDAELEPIADAADPCWQVAQKMKKQGYDVTVARWLITGKPKVILVSIESIDKKKLEEIKFQLWEKHQINTHGANQLLDEVIAFSFLVKEFLFELSALNKNTIIAHFHEWMAGLPVIDIIAEKKSIKTVFTTHATLLGRYLAINSPQFYSHLPFFDWESESKHFGIYAEVQIERLIAEHADAFTTVSEVTARECKHLLKRVPDVITPNGLNIERFVALHEFQNLHASYKEEIHQFTIGHFFPSYAFDLDKTLYFFTSGRFEYKNKGFDLCIEALSRLNTRLKKEKSDLTVVMFFISKKPFKNAKASILQNRALMDEIHSVTKAIQQEVGKKLFYASVSQQENRLPILNQFVEDYWQLRYRRTIQSWKSKELPTLVTHDLEDAEHDELLLGLQKAKLTNSVADRVKVVYHPDFITPTNPLFDIEYGQFVRGCHMGIFPSYYEPWGYTPLECMASGVPAITSDLSGFGDYLLHNMPDHDSFGMHVIERGQHDFSWSANQLSDKLYRFAKQSRRDRINQRNQVENHSAMFDWQNLISYYRKAYQKALDKR
jgi:glycogen synthase